MIAINLDGLRLSLMSLICKVFGHDPQPNENCSAPIPLMMRCRRCEAKIPLVKQ